MLGLPHVELSPVQIAAAILGHARECAERSLGRPVQKAVLSHPLAFDEDGLSDLEHALVASVRFARSEPEQLAYEASRRYGYPPGFLARYFEKLRYSFGPRERAGLYTFLEMARDVGELHHVPELRFARGAEITR